MKEIVRFDRVSKKFVLRHNRSRSLKELATQLLRRTDDSREEFWALREVSLSVQRGEAIALIGANGAGKSTLLKLITGIIKQTTGKLTVKGRVGALLELGAGFHPDMSGRENIYMNGSILGLSQTQVQERMQQIIDFAELERFIDIPIKHYSSGMYARLGFSVAVHTDPEILLVDEVLAVGDYTFQAKCIDKINELRRNGATILFVSHNLDTAQWLCERAIWLREGRVMLDGQSQQVVERYVQQVVSEQAPTQMISELGQRWGTFDAEITALQFLNGEGSAQNNFQTGAPFTVRIHYQTRRRIERPLFGVAIHRLDGLHLSGPNTGTSHYPIEAIEGSGTIDYHVDSLPLLAGTYLFSAAIYDHTGMCPFDHHDRSYVFQVRPGKVDEKLGAVYIPCRWEHRVH